MIDEIHLPPSTYSLESWKIVLIFRFVSNFHCNHLEPDNLFSGPGTRNY